MNGWEEAKARAALVAPAAHWRRAVVEALWSTGEFVFAVFCTCPPDQPLAGQAEVAPDGMRAAVMAFMARQQPRVERRGLGATIAASTGSRAYAPLESRPNDPRFSARTLKELRARFGARGLLNNWLLDARHAVLGFVSVGTAEPAAEALARCGAQLSEVAAAASNTLRQALDLVADCGAVAPRNQTGSLARLSRREREVVGLVASGLTDLNIARQLGITEETVGTHVKHAYPKLGVHSRLELLEWYGPVLRPPGE